MPMQTGQTPRRLQLQARPAYSSLRLCTYLPTWVGVLPGGGEVDSSSLSTVVGYGAVRCGAVLPGACS